MKILHGENALASRQELASFKANSRKAGLAVVTYKGTDLDVTTLQSARQSLDLLGGGQRVIVIEGLLSAPKSARGEKVASYLKENPDADDHLLLWEGKKIAPTKLKPLNAKVMEFSLPKIMFTFLEAVEPGFPGRSLKLLKTLLVSQPAELVFFMLVRQARQLLTAQFSPQLLKGPGWITGKLKSQASKFTPQGLLSLHTSLYKIDKEIKTGQSLMPLSDRLIGLMLTI